MYTTSIDLKEQLVFPTFNTAAYRRFSAFFHLPDLDELLAAAVYESGYINWGDTEYSALECYHTQNLVTPSQKGIETIEIRFKTSKEASKKAACILTIEHLQVKKLSIEFPGRAGRTAGSHVIGMIKSLLHFMNMHAGILNIEIQGFYEVGSAGWIKENGLSAFVWIPGIDRYLHVKECKYVDDVQEVKNGIRQLR